MDSVCNYIEFAKWVPTTCTVFTLIICVANKMKYLFKLGQAKN